MNDKDDAVKEEAMDIERDMRPVFHELPAGTLDEEMAKWPLDRKKAAMPPVGAILTTTPLKSPKGDYVVIPWKVTYTNASKLRISCELINYPIKVSPPPEPGPRPEDESGRTTLAVQDGVMGGGSKFK
jgi:hypothetical protein